MGSKKPRYTPDQARGRIPVVLKRIALTAVDITIQLEKHGIDSHEVESRVHALTGLAGHLSGLCHVIWKDEGLKRAAAQSAV